MMAGRRGNGGIKGKTLLQTGFPLDLFPKTLKWLEHWYLSAFPVAAGVPAGRFPLQNASSSIKATGAEAAATVRSPRPRASLRLTVRMLEFFGKGPGNTF